MAVPTLTAILKRILKQPTAPFHEYHVRREVEALLAECPNVTLKRDKFGNLLATYKYGKRKSLPTWVLAAHMDHPAFVPNHAAKGKEDAWEFIGGVPVGPVQDGIRRGLRKVVKGGQFASWDFPVTIKEGRISAPACDDLIGCALIISTFWELARLNLETTVHATFTRAEEVGWLGAWHLGNNWPFSEGAVFLSVETSRPVNGAELGNGPIVRVGDRLSVFDSESVSILMRTASEQGIRVQRCLLDGGACESTAMQALGHRSAGVSVPLGNYHNIDDDKPELAPEYVMMDDVKATLRLLTALVATKHDGIGERSIRERVALRLKQYQPHLAAGNQHFA
ncbi:MAG: putative aminopeptidase FrvX [Verrucomicrobiaceae bacterium]|nr:putative aminopeptidase FrvX [Verrucomicrobiaceae bacterium]